MDRTLRTYRRVCHLNAPDFSVIDTQCRALTVVYGLDRKAPSRMLFMSRSAPESVSLASHFREKGLVLGPKEGI